MFELERQPKRRVVQHDSRDARVAVADVVSRFEPWRHGLALMSAKAGRTHEEDERRTMREQCHDIRRQLSEARTELILRLADAPRRVSGHSRVVDVERALDSIDALVDELETRLI
jgi:hypothetical protein